jgi:hypothetical protein
MGQQIIVFAFSYYYFYPVRETVASRWVDAMAG